MGLYVIPYVGVKGGPSMAFNFTIREGPYPRGKGLHPPSNLIRT